MIPLAVVIRIYCRSVLPTRIISRLPGRGLGGQIEYRKRPETLFLGLGQGLGLGI